MTTKYCNTLSYMCMCICITILPVGSKVSRLLPVSTTSLNHLSLLGPCPKGITTCSRSCQVACGSRMPTPCLPRLAAVISSSPSEKKSAPKKPEPEAINRCCPDSSDC